MKSSSRLTFRYIAALAMIAALLTTTYINMNYLITTEERSSSLINTSGRQRMLTMKAALLSLQLAHLKDTSASEDIRQEIFQTAYQLSQSHQMLRNTFTSSPLDEALEIYVSAVRNWAQTPNERLSAHSQELQFILGSAAASGPLVTGLEAVVSEHQRKSERKIETMRRFETLMFSVGLVILLIEALYIFRPAVKTIEAERKALISVNEELRRLSSVDGLTGIANRRYFDIYLIQTWNQSKREGHELSLIMLDVDCFKLFNDTYGHLTGDDCLQQVAQALKNVVKRPADLVARYGGEEFVVLMPNTPITGALAVAEKLRQEVERLAIAHQTSPVSNSVTISLGVACVSPADGLAPVVLVKAADDALYIAKRNGRNQVQA